MFASPLPALLTPAFLQRCMDDQAVLARRAENREVARMHEDLSALYREQIVRLLRD